MAERSQKSRHIKPNISPAEEPTPVPESEPEYTTLEKFIGPLGFSRAARRNRPSTVAQSNSVSPKDLGVQGVIPKDVPPIRRPQGPERRASLRTGLDISAIALNETKTHAVIAGSNVFQILKLDERSVQEDLNIRQSVTNYMATQTLRPDEAHQRREYLVAKDVAWSHKNYSHVVATAAVNGRVAFWDVSRSASRVELSRLYNHRGQVNKIDFDPHAGYMMLTGSSDKTVQIWDIRSPNEPKSFMQFPETEIRASVRDVRWSPTDCYQFALCTEDGLLLRWDIRFHKKPDLSVPRAHEKSCYAIEWHPDGKHLASGGLDKNLKVWNFSGKGAIRKPTLQLRCPASIMRLAWRPASCENVGDETSWHCTQIATSYDNWDHRIHVWDWSRPFASQREFNLGMDGPTDFLWKDSESLLSVNGGSSGVFSQDDILWQRSPVAELPPVGVHIARSGRVFSFAYPHKNESLSTYPADRLNVRGRVSGVDEGVASRSLTDDEGIDMEFQSSHIDKIKTKSFRTRNSEANILPSQGIVSRPIIVTPLDVSVAVDLPRVDIGRPPGIFDGYEMPKEEVKALINDLAEPAFAVDRENDPSSIIDNLDRAFAHNESVCLDRGYHVLSYHWWLARCYLIPELTVWADWNRKLRVDGTQQELDSSDNTLQSETNENSATTKADSSQSEVYTTLRSRYKSTTACNPWLLKGYKEHKLTAIADGDSSMSAPYELSDFKPIDIKIYSPLHDEWIMSTYGIIVDIIDEAVEDLGILGTVAATHLLSHMAPFFFHESYRTTPTEEDHIEMEGYGMQLRHRLRRPAFSGRAICGLFATYIDYCEHINAKLSERVMRVVAVQSGFPKLASRDAFEDDLQTGEKLDTTTSGVAIACTNCNQMMLSVQEVCKFCKEPRSACPICELSLLAHPPSIHDDHKLKKVLKSTFCHQCGHSAHTDCMEGWLLSEGSHGRCPVPDCHDDCAPGIYRDARIAKQLAARDNEAAVRGSVSSTSGMKVQKDPIRVGSSAAVDKARDTLRKRSSVTERATQSGDERTPSSGGGSAWSTRASFGRKTVKIIEPGEEENRIDSSR